MAQAPQLWRQRQVRGRLGREYHWSGVNARVAIVTPQPRYPRFWRKVNIRRRLPGRAEETKRVARYEQIPGHMSNEHTVATCVVSGEESGDAWGRAVRHVASRQWSRNSASFGHLGAGTEPGRHSQRPAPRPHSFAAVGEVPVASPLRGVLRACRGPLALRADCALRTPS